MRWNLEGDVAVITGAASGIGRALACRLAREKMSLALVDVDAAGLEETARQICPTRIAVSTHQVDVADAKRMEEFAAEVVERHGRVNLLINNAGVGLLGTVEEISIEEIDWLMRINFWGVVHGVKYFLPLLRREPRARIVNLSSILGIIVAAENSAYCASKFAIRGFTEVLQQELEGSSVGVSCVYPGRIRTHISRNLRVSRGRKEQPGQESSRNIHDDNRMTSPEAAANSIVEGIKRGDPRILIGLDAVWAERLQRAFPSHYQRVVWSLSKLRRIVWPALSRLIAAILGRSSS